MKSNSNTKKTYRCYKDIPLSKKKEVYSYFCSNEDNSTPTLAEKFNLSPHMINRIIEEMRKENN